MRTFFLVFLWCVFVLSLLGALLALPDVLLAELQGIRPVAQLVWGEYFPVVDFRIRLLLATVAAVGLLEYYARLSPGKPARKYTPAPPPAPSDPPDPNDPLSFLRSPGKRSYS